MKIRYDFPWARKDGWYLDFMAWLFFTYEDKDYFKVRGFRIMGLEFEWAYNGKQTS